MTKGILAVLFFAGLIIFLIWSLLHSEKQGQEAKKQLLKLIRQVGGRQIAIEPHHVWGTRGVIQFNVKYVDANGNYQRHHVSRHLDFLGTLTGEFLWDEPLQMPSQNPDTGSSSSKEEIISEMDAEIKRLQEELRRTREES